MDFCGSLSNDHRIRLLPGISKFEADPSYRLVSYFYFGSQVSKVYFYPCSMAEIALGFIEPLSLCHTTFYFFQLHIPFKVYALNNAGIKSVPNIVRSLKNAPDRGSIPLKFIYSSFKFPGIWYLHRPAIQVSFIRPRSQYTNIRAQSHLRGGRDDLRGVKYGCMDHHETGHGEGYYDYYKSVYFPMVSDLSPCINLRNFTHFLPPSDRLLSYHPLTPLCVLHISSGLDHE